MNRKFRRASTLLTAAVTLSLIVSPIAIAGAAGDSGSPEARASAGLAKQLRKLKKKVNQLQQQVDALSRQPGPQGPAGTAPGCEGNSASDVVVNAGSVCIDRYEASLWDAPTGGNQITGAPSCSPNGQDCTDIYARSVAGVIPSQALTWFQAQRALANVGKRLPTNAEWQQAVAGTPDTGGADDGFDDCNTDSTGAAVNTGSRANCISHFGANDMVGNRYEWAADWVPTPPPGTGCPGWGSFSDDSMCMAGASTVHQYPSVLLRGGNYNSDTQAGPFATQPNAPMQALANFGFRGVR